MYSKKLVGYRRLDGTMEVGVGGSDKNCGLSIKEDHSILKKSLLVRQIHPKSPPLKEEFGDGGVKKNVPERVWPTRGEAESN